MIFTSLNSNNNDLPIQSVPHDGDGHRTSCFYVTFFLMEKFSQVDVINMFFTKLENNT